MAPGVGRGPAGLAILGTRARGTHHPPAGGPARRAVRRGQGAPPAARRAASPRAPPCSPAPCWTSTEAYGKHLLHHYADERTLHVHLGLYGKFTDGDGEPPEPVGQIRLRLASDRHWLDLRGPTACELLTPPEVAALRGRLGPDPLRADADPERAYARIRRSATPLAALLLDQSVVAGTGLIFVTEALFRAGLPPTMPGRQLTPAGWAALWADLVALMRWRSTRGRIDTVRDAHLPEAMGRPARVDRHGGEVYVYRRPGAALPRLRQPGQPGRAGRPQPLLVPHLPDRLSRPRPTPHRARRLSCGRQRGGPCRILQSPPSSSQRATSTWSGKTVSPSMLQARQCPIVQPRTRSRSSPSSALSRSSRCRTAVGRVAQLPTAHHRHDRELPLADQRLRVDHQPRFAGRRRARCRRAGPG